MYQHPSSTHQFHQQQNHHQQQQQQQYATGGGNNGEYNGGYNQSSSYHSSTYHRGVQSGQGYPSGGQSYPDHPDQAYMTHGYGYHHPNPTYPSSDVHHHQHYYNDVLHHHHHHHHGSATSTANTETYPSAEYARPGKCHPAYYHEQTGQLQQQHVHQGGEASNIPNSYVSSPDPFPSSAPGMATTATAIAAATAAVITQPPDTDSTTYNNNNTANNNNNNSSYGNFYTEQATAMAHAAPPSADNSNSSSDFNFLTNLANDFAPEYYQLS